MVIFLKIMVITIKINIISQFFRSCYYEMIESNKNIYPVEVKSGTNRNLKSLRSYANKYHPEKIFRLSPRNLIQSDDFVNVPLYAVNVLMNLIRQ